MAIGADQALTGHDGAVARVVALDGGRHDAPIQLNWQLSVEGDAVITVRGELDVATVDRVVRYVSDVIDRHNGPVTVDLRGVAFCDACGLSALIRIAAYAERVGRRLELIRPSRALTRIMRITGVDHLLLAPTHVG